MQIEPLGLEHVQDAARLVVASFDRLRSRIDGLSSQLSDVDGVADRLAGMSGVAAVDAGHLRGFLASWYPIAGFRETGRSGAYSPEWAHGIDEGEDEAVWHALYRAASTAWTAERCELHAITVLTDDPGLSFWTWNGFGMTVVDAVRPTEPLGAPTPDGYRVRSAAAADAPALAALDLEHRRHYVEPPVLMPLRPADDAAAWARFLGEPRGSAWLAEDDEGPFGFIRFDRVFGGADMLETADGSFISGAYVRPAQRRRGAASAILEAALRDQARAGLRTCAVDFETFNPEATAFWLRHFTPVCYSLVRVPEALPG
ncbi:MAG TPA: GNAT family N-acetyltransferase [Candidatus Limnocylindrales bacterium]|nr:GNAT family N-acetyltransferase [Candidatus Limnocylindrales bacterium]